MGFPAAPQREQKKINEIEESKKEINEMKGAITKH